LKTLIFTVCHQDLLPFADVLKASLPADIPFRIGMVGSKHPDTVSLSEVAPDVVFAQDYDQNALVAASKPFFATHFLKEAEAVIYFDATVKVFENLNSVTETLQNADILLTPRLTQTFGQSEYGDEKLFLNSGMYDAGFWGLRRTENTQRFLEWYQARLADRAHFDLCHGMNHDQLWLNYVPILFDKVTVAKNIGWNVALHNLHERVLTPTRTGWQVNQLEALVFMNFKECLSKESDIEMLIKKSGAKKLIENYQILIPSANLASVFSLRKAMQPTTVRWKQTLRQNLQSAIDFIETFPLYH
jgi:hypothetical protein